MTCHAVLEMMLKGEEEVEYPAMYEEYVDGIRVFLSEHEIIPLAIEEPIYSELMGVAGTPDLLCLYDGVLTLVDYKFVSAISKTKVKAQLNGYRRIYNDNGVFPEKLLAIHFKRGTKTEYPVSISDEEIDTALLVYSLKHKKYGRGVID